MSFPVCRTSAPHLRGPDRRFCGRKGSPAPVGLSSLLGKDASSFSSFKSVPAPMLSPIRVSRPSGHRSVPPPAHGPPCDDVRNLPPTSPDTAPLRPDRETGTGPQNREEIDLPTW